MTTATVTILPLPGTDSLLEGYYGLEECQVRGIVRIHCSTVLEIHSLSVSISGTIETRFSDVLQTFDGNYRIKTLFLESVCLLDDFTLEPTSAYLDIPFVLTIPHHDPITPGFGPCSQLFPPSSTVLGGSGLSKYTGKTYYTVTAQLAKPSAFPWINNIIKTEVKLSPFYVYDPRLIPLLLHPEERRWKSHVGATPLEYDIEVGSSVYGPGDKIRFAYRMLVNSEAAMRGVRILRVNFALKEVHTVGEDRCCARDDLDFPIWGHGRPTRVRGSTEIVRWHRTEYSPSAESSTSYEQYFRNMSRSGKYDGLAIPDRVYPKGDGIYAEHEAYIQLPSYGGFVPTTARPIIPSDDHICREIRPRAAFVQVRHVISVCIELRFADRITIDGGCYLADVGKKECELMLEKEVEIMPTLDYNKVIGLEVWVPEYQEKDEYLKDQVTLTERAENDDTESDYSESPPYQAPIVPGKCPTIEYPSESSSLDSSSGLDTNSFKSSGLDTSEDETLSRQANAPHSRPDTPPLPVHPIPHTPPPNYSTALLDPSSAIIQDPHLIPVLNQASSNSPSMYDIYDDGAELELQERITQAMNDILI
ncbi:hypothetical protein HK103_005100 [Boothiomyces macroporosus]|uniref:Uncharacterized protein n=1 Tax=Boothiomyces macroporosus TaxID=261099 RepID=A0AAD5Y2Z2_9FUNG|nr:hypothetical protein HK103_005100 [Boothiomyces macroporosus]